MSFVASACIIVALLLNFNGIAQTVPCNTSAPVSYTIAQTSPGEIYITDASTKPWKGGDTLKIPAGTYSVIEISNFSGDPCNKIVIINSGGQVIANNFRMRFDSRYFKITGTGTPGIDYGFKVVGGGMLAVSLAHDFEIDHVEVSGGSLGFYIKTVPDLTMPKTLYTVGSSTNYVMNNIYLHHNYFHDINGEGMYIGHTGPNGNQEGTGLIPIRMDNVEIAYNITRNTDWDGIQLSNARNAKIHDNSVWNFGRLNLGSQQAGIIMGSNTTGEVYNNTVSNGTGNGIEVFGYGTIKVYNNSVDSSGWDGTANGQDAVYSDDYITIPEINPKQQILSYNNIVRNPKPRGGIRVSSNSNNSLPASVTNNQFYIPNAPTNWQTAYIITSPPGSVQSNNTLIGGTVPVPNQLPTANAGPDQVITLPANTITITGSGTDPDGTVSAYLWTKVSGPASGTLTNAATPTVSLSGLTEGIYQFQLKVTDNTGATATDNVQVTVNPAVIVPPPATGSSRPIRVNITNGTSYNNSQWNNWNTVANLTSVKFLYEDATPSNISAVLNSQGMIVDNGTAYASAATIPPAPVLRLNSANTSDRLLTILGLDASKRYNFEFYGSRANTGNKTVFAIGNVADTVSTDNNINDVARLNNILPDNTGSVVVTLSRVGTWNYIAGFTVSEAGGTVTTNQPPVANAGADRTITLPVNTLTLTGIATDADGTISAYAWSEISGPAATLSAPTSATTSVDNLVEGVYKFELKVTDNGGAVAKDTVQVTVNPVVAPPVTAKYINVNIEGGTAFSNTQWNNWNTVANLTSAKFNYTDGSASNVNAILNSQAMIVDNGTTYASAATVPPASVLRFNSTSTSTRLLTISGLDPTKRYGLQFYGSRGNTGNKTVFTIGSITDTISTDNNINDVALLNNISPDNAGNVTISISRIGTWNYLAGFTIVEGGIAAKGSASPSIMATSSQSIKADSAAVIEDADLKIFPNPFTTSIKVQIKDKVAGNYNIMLADSGGRIIWTKSGVKRIDDVTETIDTRPFNNGNYIIKVTTTKGKSAHVVLKRIVAVQL